ncbi:MAG TPA: stage V sporulation protein AE [Epulopiscium sp.]|nr:stage V sporulation protein AE [Candidatus Epulonipiscium sp.]
MEYVRSFVVGGLICVIAQILMDRTKLMTGRIMVIFVVVGSILTGLGLYEPLVNYAGGGATVPIVGFGYSLTKGVMQEVDQAGIMGVLSGGLKASASGIAAAVAFSYLAALVSSPKSKG